MPSATTARTDWLALDVGGANIKAADGVGYAATLPFALWQAPERLAAKLSDVIAAAPRRDHIALTMTGELADCFATKAEGVAAIAAAARQAADGRSLKVYTTAGEWLSVEAACRDPLGAAASNWHALATYVAGLSDGEPALLIDAGSTTVDVIPLDRSHVQSRSKTDADRLLADELVYVGVERTPVCGLVSRLPWRGSQYPVANELFATTLDAFLVLGDIPEAPGRTDTADGRPRTREAARARLARMLCADGSTFSPEDAAAAAITIREALLATIKGACCSVVGRMDRPPTRAYISGAGEFLLRQVFAQLEWPAQVSSLGELIGPRASACAPAYALAVLARKRFPQGSLE